MVCKGTAEGGTERTACTRGGDGGREGGMGQRREGGGAGGWRKGGGSAAREPGLRVVVDDCHHRGPPAGQHRPGPAKHPYRLCVCVCVCVGE